MEAASTHPFKSSPTQLIVGASSGIGRALALALARERKHVTLVGRHEARLRRVADEVGMFGGEPLTALSDARDSDSITAALARVAAHGLGVETAYLSLGIGLGTNTETFTVDALNEMLQTNVLGVARWLEVLQPFLQAQPGGGTVAVISSLSADRALPGAGAGYSASKAAVSQLCDGLRAPWARQGIRLVTVAPGFVRTPMTADIGKMPFLMEPEDAARAILNGIRRGHSVVRFPRTAALAMGLVRLLPPRLLDRLYQADAAAPEGLAAGTDGQKQA